MKDTCKPTKKEFTQQVLDLAAANRWKLRYHTWRSDHSAPGFPDLVLVRGDRVVFAELKVDAGKLSTAQLAWLDGLRDTGKVETYVWHPLNWKNIEKELRRLST